LPHFCVSTPVAAQDLEKIDPDAHEDQGIDGDLANPATFGSPARPQSGRQLERHLPTALAETASVDTSGLISATPEATSKTYGEDDLIGAAEGVLVRALKASP
jgi:hypothetical protein